MRTTSTIAETRRGGGQNPIRTSGVTPRALVFIWVSDPVTDGLYQHESFFSQSETGSDRTWLKPGESGE